MEFKHIKLGEYGSGITKEGYCFDEIEIYGYDNGDISVVDFTDIAKVTGVLITANEEEPTIELTVKYEMSELQEDERVKVLIEEAKEEILSSLVSLHNMPID